MQLTPIFASLVLATGIQAKPLNGASNGNAARVDDINDRDFQTSLLEAHNLHRANHSADPLVWDTKAAEAAQAHANSCWWGHNRAGQNIAAGYPFAYSAIHNGWYNGEAELYGPYYGQANVPADVFHSIGHFTQVVWKSTTSVGCATAQCSNGLYTVCNYEPVGNWEGQYAANVAPPAGHPAFHAPQGKNCH